MFTSIRTFEKQVKYTIKYSPVFILEYYMYV